MEVVWGGRAHRNQRAGNSRCQKPHKAKLFGKWVKQAPACITKVLTKVSWHCENDTGPIRVHGHIISTMLTRSDGGWPFDSGFSARVPFFQGGDRCTGGLVHAEARHKKPCLCPLPIKGRFDENGENDEFAFCPLKTRASLPRSPKTMITTKMAGVTRAKAWFRKDRVCFSVNKVFGGTGRCSGQTGTVPGTNGARPARDNPEPVLGTNRPRVLLNSRVKSPFCLVCPWDGCGLVPGTIVPQGPSENCLCVLCLLGLEGCCRITRLVCSLARKDHLLEDIRQHLLQDFAAQYLGIMCEAARRDFTTTFQCFPFTVFFVQKRAHTNGVMQPHAS